MVISQRHYTERRLDWSLCGNDAERMREVLQKLPFVWNSDAQEALVSDVQPSFHLSLAAEDFADFTCMDNPLICGPLCVRANWRMYKQ